jgi:hypothetical protein
VASPINGHPVDPRQRGGTATEVGSVIVSTVMTAWSIARYRPVFEDEDHCTVVHHNLGLGITVLSFNQRHLFADNEADQRAAEGVEFRLLGS